MKAVIRPKDRDAVIQSLRAGVVPRAGQRLIQVGRTREIETMLGDIERVADGGSTLPCRDGCRRTHSPPAGWSTSADQ